MHWQVLTALMVSSWDKISKFNGSTAKEQCSESSRIFSGSMSVSRSTLLTRVKEAGREINESSWSKLMIFCLDIDNINQSSYYLPVYLWGQTMKSEKKSILKTLFQAYLMLPSAVLTTQKTHQRKANSFFLCVQTSRRSLMSATGRFSRRSRIAACTITSAWVSISPKASASNITSFITCLRSTTALPKRREYMNRKNTIEKTIVCTNILKYFYTKKLQKIWHYKFHIAHVPFHQFCVKFTFTFP